MVDDTVEDELLEADVEDEADNDVETDDEAVDDTLEEELVEPVDVLVDSVDRVVDVDFWLVVGNNDDVLEALELEDEAVVELTCEDLLEAVVMTLVVLFALEVVVWDPDADFVDEEPLGELQSAHPPGVYLGLGRLCKGKTIALGSALGTDHVWTLVVLAAEWWDWVADICPPLVAVDVA